jgi:hypothetical protein
MNYNLQRNLDLIPQFDTDTLFCLKNFYRDKVNRVGGVETKNNQDDLELILYYNELCHELYERGECD